MGLRYLMVVMLAGLLAACGDSGERRAAPAADAGDGGAEAPGAEASERDPAGRETYERDATDDRDPGSGEEAAVIRVWFSRGEAPASVERRVARADPESALSELLEGPGVGERAAGLTSWFSDSTADALQDVERRGGFLVVDFRGLDRLIPGAGSSAGSAQLLTSLDSTVFQFEDVDSVEYRLDGSCDAFWGWLQRECRVVRRP